VFSFIIASPRPLRQRRPLPPGLRFLDQATVDHILMMAPTGPLMGEARPSLVTVDA